MQAGRPGGRSSTIDVDRLGYRRVRLVGTTFRTRGDAEHARIAGDISFRLLPAVVDRPMISVEPPRGEWGIPLVPRLR
ncbi:hypothetical protein [Saccharopolyspora spinosa]|uniref:hypothetical protein n=1 Tax=Saccharopolyspora spinosa TaxID=60894 RepID=UPI00117A238C|nr:hypothetical protein [Saccharopolyspora spinosa]